VKKYFSLMKINIINEIVFRFDFLFRIISNLLHITLIYFLWRSIYAGDRISIAGLEFLQAFTYMAVTGIIFSLIETWSEYWLSNGIISGDIIMHMLVPVDLHIRTVMGALAQFVSRFFAAAVPAFLFLFLVFGVPFPAGGGIFLFLISIVFALLISVNFDFAVGVSAFGLESIIGVKFMKDAVILFFSGAVIPLPFFPDAMKKVLMLLPFQAMFHTPVSIFLGVYSGKETLKMMMLQIFWIICFMVVGRLYYRKTIHRLTVNGG
jgi:ABC-2 type transport system permease protein